MDVDGIRDALKFHGKFGETHQIVAEFRGWRDHPTEGGKEVTVRIWDMGPEQPQARYSVEAFDEDGRGHHGNPDSTIRGAVGNVHWMNFDGPTPEPGLEWT